MGLKEEYAEFLRQQKQRRAMEEELRKIGVSVTWNAIPLPPVFTCEVCGASYAHESELQIVSIKGQKLAYVCAGVRCRRQAERR